MKRLQTLHSARSMAALSGGADTTGFDMLHPRCLLLAASLGLRKIWMCMSMRRPLRVEQGLHKSEMAVSSIHHSKHSGFRCLRC